MQPNVLAIAVGDCVRELRLDKTQDDVARAARRCGLSWTRSMVMALEAGRRELTIDEFVRVPAILERLGVARTGFSVSLSSSAGGQVDMQVGDWVSSKALNDPWMRPMVDAERVQHAHQAMGWWKPAGTAALVAKRGRVLQAAYEAAGGNLEQKVGRASKLDPLVVSVIALERWGLSLSDERDRRVDQEAGADVTPRARQALRGHVTRAMLRELAPSLDEAAKNLAAAKRSLKARKRR